MREVVAVEDCNDISAGVEFKEVIEVIGFGLGAWNIDDGELWVLFLHFYQFGLEGFDGLGCVVD